MHNNRFLHHSTTFLIRIGTAFKSWRVGFSPGHVYLTDERINEIKHYLDSPDDLDIARRYEKRFGQVIGRGSGLSFASGRMGFYCLLKTWGIGPNDEVILTGFTCSVMANAVLRTGATPVFSDVDPKTFGSDPTAIERAITPRTKAIVAQHSFGIPCDIESIVRLAKEKGIRLVEDCAISFGSTVNGVTIGNFGDAALFSTDHSKPLNTLIGGFLYSTDTDLIWRVKVLFPEIPNLSQTHQRNLFDRLLYERKWHIPARYSKADLYNCLNPIRYKLSGGEPLTFLKDDFSHPPSVSRYPYPAALPTFLCQVGFFELERWGEEKIRRKKRLQQYLDMAKGTVIEAYLPAIYFDPNVDIVPLRFVYAYPDSLNHKRRIDRRIDTSNFWFSLPIICCPQGPASLGYVKGSCPQSERIGPDTINWPCIIPEAWDEKLFRFFREAIES